MSKTAEANPRPQISIVIPCFNRSRFIAEAIQSSLSQGPSVEVIVIDDGSTDESWRIIKSFDAARAFRTENRGVSAARNRGAREARGRFIQFLDSDDRIPPDALAPMLQAAKKLGANKIVVGEAVTIDEHGSPTAGPLYGFPVGMPAGPIARHSLLSNVMSTCLPLFPKTAFEESTGFDETIGLGEDIELAFRILGLGYEFVRVPLLVAEVREHGDGRLSRNFGPHGFAALLRLYRGIWAETSRYDTHPPTDVERAILAARLWTIGRDASRAGFRPEAEALFTFSNEVGGADAIGVSYFLRLLYRFLPAYLVEQYLQFAKTLLGQRRGEA